MEHCERPIRSPPALRLQPYTVVFSRQARRNLHENLPLDVAAAALTTIDGPITVKSHRVGKPFDEALNPPPAPAAAIARQLAVQPLGQPDREVIDDREPYRQHRTTLAAPSTPPTVASRER
jgi:hypothetical protein